MAKATVYHNPRCSKSRAALEFLRSNDVEVDTIEYLKDPLSSSELSKILGQLVQPISEMVRVKDPIFKEAPFDVSSKQTICEQLSEKPKLMERPLIVYKSRAVIGRPTEAIEQII